MIHTNIYGPNSPNVMSGCKYFIIFIDNYSRFGWIELLVEKFESLNAFKNFKATIKLMLNKKIKCVHSNRGGEYYGRYDETNRNLGPFAKYLKECGIEASYSMHGTLQSNGVVEMRN